MLIRSLNGQNILMDKAGDPPNPPPADDKKAAPTPEPSELLKEFNTLKVQIAELLKAKDQPKDKELLDKVKETDKAADDKKKDSKAMESALKFNIMAPNFLKDNESLLPKTVAGIFSAAEKEKYESEIDRANAVKSGIVQAFFQIQDNLDLLTPGQKNLVEEYLRLTKNGKEQQAQHVYESIFEPTLEMLKRVKKAEEVNRAKNGFGTPSDAEAAYKEKMYLVSKNHYMKKEVK